MPRDPMRRHFCVTLWLDADGASLMPDADRHDVTPIISNIIDTCRGLRAHYLCWSLEDSRLEPSAGTGPAGGPNPSSSEPGGLHLHVYLECERTVRWSTVVRRFQSMWMGAHVECRKGWRDTAREYHMGLKHGVEKPTHITHGEWGEWRKEHLGVQANQDFAEAAASMIMEGQTPKAVARAFPRWFISRGAGVVRLWETLNRCRWA